MTERLLRVACFQLRTHPALILEDWDLLCEPLAPTTPEQSIRRLARSSQGVRNDLDAVRVHYTSWLAKRLADLLKYVRARSPRPDILAFSECAIPSPCLPQLREFSADTGITIVGGTHTPRYDATSMADYRAARISKRELDAVRAAQPPAPAVLPVITPQGTHLFPKMCPSVFELTEVVTGGQPVATPSLTTLRAPAVTIGTLVCNEALRLQSTTKPVDLLVLLARERDPQRFAPILATSTTNRVPVMLVNEGEFGGSGVFALVDRRMSLWWFDEPHHGRLPVGEYYLEVVLDLNAQAIQVGVAAPSPPARLTCLAPVFGIDDVLLPAERDARTAAEKQDVHMLADVLSRYARGTERLPLAFGRWQHVVSMLRNGQDVSAWLDMAGDRVVTEQAPPLDVVERQLAGMVAQSVHDLIAGPGVESLANDLVGHAHKLGRFLARAAGASPTSSRQTQIPATSVVPIGQESLIADIRTFVSRAPERVALVTGLEAIGKSTVAQTALQQVGARTMRLRCLPGATADYIFEAILKSAGMVPNSASPRADFRNEELSAALASYELLWIEDCHHLVEESHWRTEALSRLLGCLVELDRDTACKLLLESRWALPLDLPLGTATLRRRVAGLRERDALAFLEQHLHRSGVSVANVDDDDKRTIVRAVDGHPGMLILCAEAIGHEGVSRVVADLKGRRGFYLGALSKLVRGLGLSRDAERALAALSRCRLAVPSVVLIGILGDRHGQAIDELVAACIAERDPATAAVHVVALLRNVPDPGLLDAKEWPALHKSVSEHFVAVTRSSHGIIAHQAAVEANYHAALAGVPAPIDLAGLRDAVAGAARTEYEAEHFERVVGMVAPLCETPGAMTSLPEDLLALLADSYAWTSRFKEAMEIADAVIRRNRDYAWLYTEACKAALRARETGRAKDALARAEAVAPGFYRVALLRGQIAEQERDRERAVTCYREAVRLSQRDMWPYFYLARALLRSGEPAEALEVVAKGREIVQELTGRSARDLEMALLEQEMIALVLTGDHEAAQTILNVFSERKDLRPESIVCAAYVRAYYAADAPSDAVRAFDLALDQLKTRDARGAHTRAQIALLRGKLMAAKGDLSGAERELQMATELDAQNMHMRLSHLRVTLQAARNAKGRGESDVATGIARRASRLARSILQAHGGNAEALDAEAEVRREFGV